MSKENPDFDTARFAYLLNKAKGNRSINQYAKVSGVSSAHISRLLREKIESPPNPITISKLSSASKDRVSYESLMVAAGYMEEESLNLEHTSTNNKDKKSKIKKMTLSFMSSIYHLEADLNWSILNNPGSDNYKYIRLLASSESMEPQEWEIKLVSNLTHEELILLYGRLAILKPNQGIRYGILVLTLEEFELITKNYPKSLSLDVFAILLDIEKNEVVKKEQIAEPLK